MHDTITRPKTAAWLGVLLALPFAFIFVIAKWNIEPIDSFMKRLVTGDGERMHAWGLAIIIVSMLLLPVGLYLNAAAIGRRLAIGENVLAYPINFALAVGLLLAIAALLGAFAIDQYPCWTGVPNCD